MRFPSSISRRILAAVLAFSLGASDAGAWSTFDASWTSDPSQPLYYGCPLGEGLWANPGDAVSLRKWNLVTCLLMQAEVVLRDAGRNYTPFVVPVQNTIAGIRGQYVPGIHLGADPEWKNDPSVNFYDARYPYAGAAQGLPAGNYTDGPNAKNPLGQIRYARTGANGFVPDSLNFNDFSGGLWATLYSDQDFAAAYPSDNVVGTERSDTQGGPAVTYGIGWIKINLDDSAPFDMNCMYRVRPSGGGTMWNPQSTDPRWWYLEAVRADRLRTTSTGIWSTILASDKKHGWSDETGEMLGTVQAIEKFCLPSYNPRNY